MKNLTGIYWIKDEARYIPEYVEFHLLQGFDHFIFYDNNSKDNLLEVISPYIENGLVEIREYPNYVNNRHNFWLMDFCNNEQKGKTKWLHYHALDERLFCPDGRKVSDLLTEYEDYGGLAVAWIYLNSSGHEKRPEGLIIDNFVTALEDHEYHIKTIVNTEHVTHDIGCPHNFRYKNGKFTVDEKYNVVVDAFNPTFYSYEKIKLHHYVTMSKEEFEIKMNKGLLDIQGLENVRRPSAESQWAAMHSNDKLYTQNRDLQRYSKTVKENIKKRYSGKEHLLQYINH